MPIGGNLSVCSIISKFLNNPGPGKPQRDRGKNKRARKARRKNRK